MGGIHRYPPGGGYGVQLKKDYRKYYGATISFEGRGEMIPNDDTYCEIDPTVVDRFGIPVLKFHWKWTDHEINQVKHMRLRRTSRQKGRSKLCDSLDSPQRRREHTAN